MITFKRNNKKYSVFKEVENALDVFGVIDKKLEDVIEVLLLIGGTENQEPHFDNPRLYVCRRLKTGETEDCFDPCHEINRKHYNEAVMGTFGPASMIFDVTGRRCGVRLGVLTSLLNITGEQAQVKFGNNEDVFPIVTTDPNYSVIHINGAGVVFGGDFPHFGVRNVQTEESDLNALMTKLFNDLISTEEVAKTKQDTDPQSAWFKIFEETPGLDELTRLFIKVKPKQEKFKFYDLDVVGTIPKDKITENTYDYPK